MLRKLVRVTIIVLIGVAFIYMAINLAEKSTAAEVGGPAPDFTLENMDGNMVSLTDYRGEFVILNFLHPGVLHVGRKLLNFNRLKKSMEIRQNF